MALNLVWLGDLVARKVQDTVSRKMEQGLAQGVSTAKELVPKDTHQTEDSIGYYWDRATMTGTIYAGTAWAYWLETGTSRMAARPFLRPAIAEVGRAFGLAHVDAQFTGLPGTYHDAARQHERSAGRRTVIGHRVRGRR